MHMIHRPSDPHCTRGSWLAGWWCRRHAAKWLDWCH